ncbi:hypothetical protein PSTT_08028 [Puccinia striiformis]|uniref:Uncharacterized protein n=1 Tax=Puccinia striiformis TaxID=27350 RepID=A0A2S4VE02_9BASI|nr:hypothetical protein PSTT_08028 [Puccinia striiformis]
MTNWMQLFGVTLILVNCCITSSSAAHVAGKSSPDDGELTRAPESQSRLKTRRMMMGLGSEMSWGTPDFRAGSDTPINFKRALSSRTLGSDLYVPKWQQSTSGNEAESFRDSVIVLRTTRETKESLLPARHQRQQARASVGLFSRLGNCPENHKRSEVKPTASSATSATVSSASESASFRDSVIVLKNHKRSEGKPYFKRDIGDSKLRLPVGLFSRLGDCSQNHVRPEGHSESGAASGNTASKAGSFRDSVIVLKNHRRSEGEDTREQDIITNSESK